MATVPKGIRNNNPGNLRFANQTGAVRTSDNFARFSNYDQGVRALDRQLDLYYTGNSPAAGNIPRTSIREIISVYAPTSENNTERYIATVSSRMGLDPDETIPVDRLPNFRDEIVRVELGSFNGQQLTTETGRELAQAYHQSEAASSEDTTTPAQPPIPTGVASAGDRIPTEGGNAAVAAVPGPNSTNQIFPNFKDNILSDLDNPSYYIRFFIMGERDERTIPGDDPIFASIRNINKVVLAETAVTGINIESLELKTTVGPNQATKLVQALEFKMRIFEPMGLTFYDKLLAAARDLAVVNFQKAPYYIEIKFHGYNTNGSYADNVGPDGPNTKKWVYKVLITDIQSEFTKAGTVYDITLVQSNDLGTGDNFFATDSSFNMSGSTVGEVMREWVLHKANSEIAQYGFQRNKYEIILLPLESSLGDVNAGSLGIDTDPNNWQIFNPSNTTSSDTTSTTTQGQGSASFAKGNTVANIIEQSFAATLEGHKLVIRNDQPEVYGDKSQYIVVPWILTSVKIREEEPIYDPVIQDYNREITYYIIPYLTTAGTASIDQQIPIQQRQRDKMIENLKVRVETGKLEKKYDYLFTGENIEVLNVDFKFDTFFKAVIPLYGGTTNISRYRSGGALGDGAGNISDFRESSALAQQQDIQAARLRGTQARSANRFESEQAAGEATVVANEARARLSDLSVGASVAAQNIARQNRENVITGEVFAEDISSFSGNLYTVTIDKSIRESGQEGAGNIEANAVRQSMTTALLNQIKDRAMVTINLEIRGDPYWLGITNLEENFYQLSSNFNNGLAKYNDGAMYFILKTLIPQGIEELNAEKTNRATEGEIKLSVNEAFTGLYITRYVHHKFNKGSFTQTLEAVRDANIDINLIGGLNG